jgi:hypothetical protein
MVVISIIHVLCNNHILANVLYGLIIGDKCMDFDIFVKVSNGEQNRMKRKIRTHFVVLQRALSVANARSRTFIFY